MSSPLSIRLSMVLGLAPEGNSRLIDVGSDHGLLALEALKKNLVSRVVCTDIHKAPAEKSRICLSMAGYSSVSEVYCTDGLKGVPLEENDSVVIAGMGGLNIIEIIEEAKATNIEDIFKTVSFILQPQKSTDLVRKYLSENGFEIVDEAVCEDRDIYYQASRAIYRGTNFPLTLKEQFYGPRLLERQDDELVKKVFDHLTEIYNVRSRGDLRIRQMLEE